MNGVKNQGVKEKYLFFFFFREYDLQQMGYAIGNGLDFWADGSIY